MAGTALRALGLLGATLFAWTSLRIYGGSALLPTSSPFPFYAYPVLMATLLGWAWRLVQAR
jgi:hypothetical protein